MRIGFMLCRLYYFSLLLLLIFTPAEVAAIDPFFVLTKFCRVFDREVFHIGGLLEAAAAFLCMPFLASIRSYEAPTFIAAVSGIFFSADTAVSTNVILRIIGVMYFICQNPTPPATPAQGTECREN